MEDRLGVAHDPLKRHPFVTSGTRMCVFFLRSQLQVVFFLLGALTIVEIMDAHKGHAVAAACEDRPTPEDGEILDQPSVVPMEAH